MSATGTLAEIIPFRSPERPTEAPEKTGKAVSHERPHEAVEPIKELEDIQKAKEYFLNQTPRWKSKPTNLRNYMMFVISINNGIRISDLLGLKIDDVLTKSGEIEDEVYIREGKTGKTRYLFFGKGSKEAIRQYLDAIPEYSREDYLFKSSKSKKGESRPLQRWQAWKIVSDMGKAISEGKDHELHLGTHSMRKTFGYQRIMADPENQMIVAQVSEIYNHSSMATTYKYLGMDIESKRELCTAHEL